jgi:hypothetical protein
VRVAGAEGIEPSLVSDTIAPKSAHVPSGGTCAGSQPSAASGENVCTLNGSPFRVVI